MLDTKSRNNKINKLFGHFMCLLIIAGVALAVVGLYPFVVKKSTQYADNLQDNDIYSSNYEQEFISELYKGNYSLYWKMLEGNNSNGKPSDYMLKKFAADDNDDKIQITIGNETYSYVEREDFYKYFNDFINNWRDTFFETIVDLYKLEYCIIDNETGETLTNSAHSLENLMNNDKTAQELKDKYEFYSVFQYDKNGKLKVTSLQGLQNTNETEFMNLELSKEVFHLNIHGEHWNTYKNVIKSPENVTIIYASPTNNFYYHLMTYGYSNMSKYTVSGIDTLFIMALIILVIFALLIPRVKHWGIGAGFLYKMPVEVSLLTLLPVLFLYEEMFELVYYNMMHQFFSGELTVVAGMFQVPRILVSHFQMFALLTILFGFWFITVLSIRPLFIMGVKKFIKYKSLTMILLFKIIDFIKRIRASYRNMRLESSVKKVFIILFIINVIVTILFCFFWFFGIVFLIPYYVIIFYIITKKLYEIMYQYTKILNIATKMSEGDLEVTINEDLGVFQTLNEKLKMVQTGFKKAVIEETKSQNMKSELITNVSHDLKTPLTAIITYINLLNDENLTEEQRASYIQTIDNKSQRLKRLIEDLFEVSKANSNNITLNLVDIDLISLIKEVQLELNDKIEASGISFRNSFPKGKVIMSLDSEKTYRIIENLITNIAKYAMPGTRAYVDIEETAEFVEITFKNISATELDISADEISERFVRGDKSRNTEGSGLGLAIVKSFVEIQGGKFQVILDGDLFKAKIHFERTIDIEEADIKEASPE